MGWYSQGNDEEQDSGTSAQGVSDKKGSPPTVTGEAVHHLQGQEERSWSWTLVRSAGR